MARMIILGFIFLILNGCATSTLPPSKTKPSSHNNRTEPTFLNRVGYSFLINMRSLLSGNEREERVYRCDELTQQQAYYLYRNGHSYLDRDKDGLPCEKSGSLPFK